MSIFESQYGRRMTTADGTVTQLGIITDQLNLAFSVIFIVELLINLLGHWPRAFMENPWVRNHFFLALSIRS